MVELKRWVAKEATDNGQVVEDSKLTDQAIFDRLDADVAFRSVATRLLQRYGYLMPTPNPDSDFAKKKLALQEKQLVLQERARRLVQIEAQEDADSLKPQRSDQGLERTTTCDPRRDENCAQQWPGKPPKYSHSQRYVLASVRTLRRCLSNSRRRALANPASRRITPGHGSAERCWR